MHRSLRAGCGLLAAIFLCGCSTISGDWTQKLQIETLDDRDRPVEAMQCQVGEGGSALTVTTPAHDVKVRRSAQALAISCKSDHAIATATVKPRRERMEEALLPFGSVGVFVDHVSGALYGYPTTLRLRIGQHVVLEHGGEAKVASAEPLEVPVEVKPPAAASAPPVVVAVAAPKPAGVAPKGAAAAAPIRKAAASATGAATARTARTQSTKVALSTPAAAKAAGAGGTAALRSAPVNW